MSDGFPEDVKQFLDQRIESLAQLEMLLLLRGQPAREWNASEVAAAMYWTADRCAGQLVDLERRGFLVCTDSAEGRYRYQPADAETGRLMGELAKLYQERRVAVITLIYSKPIDRVQTFADAFRLRKEE